MPTATVFLLTEPATADTPRRRMFCSWDATEVFSSFVTANSVCQPDPWDVERIHDKAREQFVSLFNRAGGVGPGAPGKAFLLKGVAGSGKTHLLRAFRQYAHTHGGYCGYMEMVSQADAYAVYVLRKLVDSLSQPYTHGAPPTGLARLARGMLDGLVGETTTAEKVDEFCRDWPDDTTEVSAKVEQFADLVIQDTRRRFDDRDLNLIRALLYCLPEDRLYRTRALMWLRGEELSASDRGRLGGLPNQTGDAAAFHLIAGLGRVMAAVDGSPLVVLVDQLDDVTDAVADPKELDRRLRNAVDVLVSVAMQVPNAVVVVACVEAFYAGLAPRLQQAKRDRLEHDPPAQVLTAARTAEEVGAILALRLADLFTSRGVDVDPAAPLDPFEPRHLAKLAGGTARMVLQWLYAHQRECMLRGRWIEPNTAEVVIGLPDVPPVGVEIDHLWNDFVTAHPSPTLDEEADRAKLLAFALGAASAELPAGVTVGASATTRFIDVDINLPGNAADRVAAAVCDGNTRGNGLRDQLDDVGKRAGEHPVALVRSTEFPGPNTQVGKSVLKLTGPKTQGRRVVVSEQEWLTLDAFRAFHTLHAGRPDFAAWQRGAKPLSELKAVRDVLKLSDLADKLRDLPPVAPTPPAPPVGVVKPAPLRVAPPPVAVPADALALGVSRGAHGLPVALAPGDLTRHMAFLGGPGSGKTTAALALVEQLLLRGVPALLVDRKGDLARYADPDAYTDADGRDGERARLRDSIDVALFTPGNAAGRGLRLPVVPDGLDGLPTTDREDQLNQTAAALFGMIAPGLRTLDPRQVILAKALEVLGKTPGGPATLRAVRELVAEPDDALAAALSYDMKHYKKLAEGLQTLEGMHHRLFTDGDPLDPDRLFGRGTFAVPGKTRLSIVSTQFLGDKARTDFWVAQLLLSLGRWSAKRPAKTLQAVVLLDEADQYLPAVGKPATKDPAEYLLKRARSAGVGLFLATQSPGDFDYKCRDQILTWLVGRVAEANAHAKLKATVGGRADVLEKLAKQSAGQFVLAREGKTEMVSTGMSLIRTEQVPADRVLDLARHGAAAG